ncbi:hypothetical protein MNBD_GAMMA15-1903 [hydrothermal vent metagenome]|uniref:peptidylprolyl isomerase n=1 Tax=hydrothermal vent metagenome TaxID=652676 RepID=A0A3B0YE71_9ZZZZ
MTISVGCRVTMHYALRLADGMEADSSIGGEPVSFVMGDGTLDKGLELALYGLLAGRRQALTLMPGQAFGLRSKQAIKWMDRSAFPLEITLEPGLIVGFTDEQGQELPGAVLELNEKQVKVDFNHPLAGREISFEVEILEVEYPPLDEE